ncbi:MAG: hypothetical protein M3P08_07645 [Thermoproteota archaeon]|nr:hypothetical protein [Thermoproteota archaeon]
MISSTINSSIKDIDNTLTIVYDYSAIQQNNRKVLQQNGSVVKNINKTHRLMTKIARKVSKMSQVLNQIRRVHFMGKTDNSCRMVIPRQIVNRVGIGPHEYMRVSLDEEMNRIIIEKLQEPSSGENVDNK